MPRHGAIILSDCRKPTLTLSCQKCERHSIHRIAELIAEYGHDKGLPDLRHALRVDYPRHGNPIYERCGAYYVTGMASRTEAVSRRIGE